MISRVPLKTIKNSLTVCLPPPLKPRLLSLFISAPAAKLPEPPGNRIAVDTELTNSI